MWAMEILGPQDVLADLKLCTIAPVPGDAVPGFLPLDSASQARLPLLLDRPDEIAAIG